MFTRWISRLRAHQLEKALYWMQQRRDLAERHGRMEDVRLHEQHMIETRQRIAALRA